MKISEVKPFIGKDVIIHHRRWKNRSVCKILSTKSRNLITDSGTYWLPDIEKIELFIEQHTCDKCHQVSEDKLCMECYCAVCGDELEGGWCIECSREDEEEDDE